MTYRNDVITLCNFFFLVLLEIFLKEEENKLLITGYFEWNNITLNCFELFTDSKSHLNSFSSHIKFLRCLQSGTYLVGATSSNIWKKIVTLSEKKKNPLFELKIYKSINHLKYVFLILFCTKNIIVNVHYVRNAHNSSQTNLKRQSLVDRNVTLAVGFILGGERPEIHTRE